jgi:hypothetical protein
MGVKEIGKRRYTQRMTFFLLDIVCPTGEFCEEGPGSLIESN